MDYEKSLQDMTFKLLVNNKYMFYGLFLAELNKTFSDDFPTAGITKHADSQTMTLVIGKKYWRETLHNDSRKMATLLHDLTHIMWEHLSDMSEGIYGDKKVGGMAMDIAINQTITEELPKLDKDGKRCNVFMQDFPNLGLKANESTLYYYGQLMKAKENKQQSKGKGQDSKAPGKGKGNGEGTSGDGAMDEVLEEMEKGGDASGGSHSKWDDLTSGMGQKESELMRKEIQEMIKRAADESSKLKGDIPSFIQNAINENFGRKEPVLSWKTLFNRFVGSAITTDVKQTRKRPNFRFPDAPTNKYKAKIKIVCGIDSSGSVGDEDLKDFFAQIEHMWKAGVKVDVCIWDAACEDPFEYKGEKTYKRTKGGGTHASCFTEYVNDHANSKNWTCAIGLTDGYVESKVTDTKIPLLWVITKGGSMQFGSRGRKIMIN